MRNLFILFVLSFLLMSCGGPQQMTNVSAGKPPTGFINPPQDPNVLFAAQTATSQDMQTAIDKAVVSGRAELARQLETRVQSWRKRFDEEVGTGVTADYSSFFSQTTEEIVSESLTGSRIRSQEVKKDGDFWRAYVIMEYPVGAANRVLVEKIRQNEDVRTRFEATEAFEELERKAKEYEAWKKEHGY